MYSLGLLPNLQIMLFPSTRIDEMQLDEGFTGRRRVASWRLNSGMLFSYSSSVWNLLCMSRSFINTLMAYVLFGSANSLVHRVKTFLHVFLLYERT